MAHRIRINKSDFMRCAKRSKPADMRGLHVEPEQVDARAKLVFLPKAWVKMQMLIQRYDSEVAWHGVAYKADNWFEITDVLVYPQVVTSVTVDTDVKKYGEWLAELTDEQINNLRCQGHSHVNMGVTPSSVDIDCENDLLAQLGGRSFYIFLIWNKKGERTVRIFDYEKDLVYETEDVDVVVSGIDENFNKGLREFVLSKRDEMDYMEHGYLTDEGDEWDGFDKES